MERWRCRERADGRGRRWEAKQLEVDDPVHKEAACLLSASKVLTERRAPNMTFRPSRRRLHHRFAVAAPCGRVTCRMVGMSDGVSRTALSRYQGARYPTNTHRTCVVVAGAGAVGRWPGRAGRRLLSPDLILSRPAVCLVGPSDTRCSCVRRRCVAWPRHPPCRAVSPVPLQANAFRTARQACHFPARPACPAPPGSRREAQSRGSHCGCRPLAPCPLEADRL